jgi:hypothetical protein
MEAMELGAKKLVIGLLVISVISGGTLLFVICFGISHIGYAIVC